MARPQSLQQLLPVLSRVLRRFRPQIRKQRSLITASFVAMLAEVALSLLEPWPLKFIFDHVILSQDQQLHDAHWIASIDPSTLLLLSALALVAVVGLKAMASFCSTVGFALAGNRVLTEVRSQLYRHLQALSLSFHTKAKNGDLVMRIIGDIGILKEITVTSMLPLVGNCLVLSGMLCVMFFLNWQLALLALTTIPLFWLLTTRFSRKIKHAAREQRQREGAMAATAAESMAAIKTVQALSLEESFAQAFANQNNKSLKEGVKTKRLSASLERTVDVLIAIATALVLWQGTRLVMQNSLTPGQLLVFLAYLKNAFKPVRNFAKYTGRLAKAAAAGERVLDVLDETPQIKDRPDARTAPPFRGEIRFEHVGFAYEPDTRRILDRVSIDIPAGHQAAIVGPSGIGKSTLTSLVLRLYDPQHGRVLIDGVDIRDYTLESLRGQTSIVLQDTLLFAASVRENIAYARPDTPMARVVEAAEMANAHGFIDSLPQGYETMLGERGVNLSCGQRQRIAIARAAIRNTPILILDEPTTGLDEANQTAVSDALQRLAKDRTTFVITHDLSLAARADHIYYLENGRILEHGTHDQLMRANLRYAGLYRQQAAPSLPHAGHQEPLYALGG